MKRTELYIGRESFQKIDISYHVITLENHTIRDMIDMLTMGFPKDITMTDYSMLSRKNRSILLKFIEEYKGNIIVHSSEDIFDPIILSRFNKVIKIPDEVEYEVDSVEYKVRRNRRLYPTYMHGGAISRRILKGIR